MQFQGVVIGNPPNTPFGIIKLEGLGKQKVRSGNTPRPRTRGSFVGMNLLDTRTITATLDVGPPFGSYGNLASALASLRTACSTEGSTEQPLWIQLPNQPLVACMARVTGFDPAWDVTADLGSTIKSVPLQFEATDPYLYVAPTLAPSIGLPVPGIGFTFPITFPFSFGGGTSPNSYTATNLGDVPCWPVLVITGPCLNPTVQNQSITGNPFVSLNISLNAGDQLVIDCDLQSILYYPAGATVGAPYPQILNAGSTFFALVSGANTIAFNSQDTSVVAGTLALWWTSAYDGLL
jgi:hypothetical protein